MTDISALQAVLNGADLMNFMGAMRPFVDQQVLRLRVANFRTDPLLGEKDSVRTSIFESAKKRHGRIIEEALRASLAGSNRFQVWRESKFAISPEAESIANGQSYTDSLLTTLPYGQCKRTIQIDLIVVFDHVEQTISAYEIKRGFGLHDAGKTRQIKRDLHCVQLLLKSYAEQRGFHPTSAQARIIFYYGRRSVKGPMTLCADELDDHFGMAVLSRMQAVDNYFREELAKLVESI